MSKRGNKSPPKFAEKIIALFAHYSNSLYILGDLEEDFQNKYSQRGLFFTSLWYWFQCLIILPGISKYKLYWSFTMFKNYLKIAFRNIKKQKVYSCLNISGLVIGMAASLLITQYVVYELSYDKFNKNVDNIYRVRNDRVYADIQDKSAGCPPALGPTLKREFPEIIETARIYNTTWTNNIVSFDPNLNLGENSNKSSQKPLITFNEDKIFYAEDSFLDMFSFTFINGPSSGALSEPNTAVITESSAIKYFGDEDPVGKTIKVANGYGLYSFNITGVLEDIPSTSHVKFKILLSFKTLVNIRSNANSDWGWNAFNTFILLDHDANPNDLELKFPELVDKYGLSSEDYQRVFSLQPLKDIHLYSNLRHEPEINGDINTVYFLSLIAIFILLIAWINYINLTTAKSALRAREIGVRKVLGSQKSELIKQFLLEGLLLNSIALFAAIALVHLSMPFFAQMTGLPIILTFSKKIWILIGLSIATGSILSNLYPAFMISAFNPISVLKESIRGTSKGVFLRKSLVITQFVIAIILIVSTIVVYNQLSFMRNQDLGMSIEQTLIVKAPSRQRGFVSKMQKFKDETLRFTAIKNISASSTIPGKEYSNASSGIRPLQSAPEDGKRCFFIDIDEEFFTLFKVEFAAGDNFTANSKYNESVILNEQAVKILGLGSPKNAVTKKVLLGGLGGQIVEVVGVVKDYHHKSLNNNIEPVIFNPLANVGYFSLKIGDEKIDNVISIVKNKWNEIYPNQPFEYYFLDEIFSAQYNSDRQFGKVFRMFTGLTILISCIGLFGLVSFSFAQKTKEVGIRKLLGASVNSIVSLLTKELIRLILYANLIAWPLAYFTMSSWLQSFAYRTSIDWWIFVIAGITTLVIALVTVSFHSLKAAHANPVDTLRSE